MSKVDAGIDWAGGAAQIGQSDGAIMPAGSAGPLIEEVNLRSAINIWTLADFWCWFLEFQRLIV